jgi:FO synthase
MGLSSAYATAAFLERAGAGDRVEATDFRALAAMGARELGDLMAAARAMREQGFGTRVTYSPKVFIPLTQLCRDVCHYCTFARPPRRGEKAYLGMEQVLEIAQRGREAGCVEALFTLGDKPEMRYRVAREELAVLGHGTTIEYLAEAAETVLDKTGLLPHVNPGVLEEADLRLLRRVSASMGIMLESASHRLMEPGLPHHGSPDKDPDRRIETLAAAGRLRVPFTSGILIGIGETRLERLEALLVLRVLHEEHGHLQEVIVQNFRAKAGTLMAQAPEPSHDELLWTIAAARLVLGPGMSIQSPPNLSDSRFPGLLEAGINDWGGVSPVTIDHVNPEAPWPDLAALEAATREAGLDLVPRMPVYPQYAAAADEWLDPEVRPHVLAASDSLGLARGHAWHPGGTVPVPERAVPPLDRRRGGGAVGAALSAVRRGELLDEDEVTTLFEARGADLAAVLAAADQLRREVCGDTVTYVVNRNINYTNVCYFRCTFCAFSKGKLADNLRGRPYVLPIAEIVRRSAEAWDRGATEVCLQGGIHPSFDGEFYASVVREVRAAVPGLHIHAFTPLEVWQGAATLRVPIEDYLTRLKAEGLGSLPGTSAEIFDDEVRRLIAPDKVTADQWCEVMRAAHEVGLRSTSTIMFGHVEGPRHCARHLLTLRDLQQDTGGLTEFVPLPFVHMEAPMALKGRSRHGPTIGETLLMHAVGRLALHPHVTNVQASWVKLGPEGSKLALAAGVNDLGGTLMNESISRAAGAQHGQELAPDAMEALIRSAGRIPRQRTTLYGEPDPAQRARSFGAPPLATPRDFPAKEQGLRPASQLSRPGLEERAARLAVGGPA